MKKLVSLRNCSLGFLLALATTNGQECQELVNLSFSTNAGDLAAHPIVSNISPWVNGSEIYDDPFGSGLYVMPDDDFGNGYAGLTVPALRFGHKWGFEGSFDITSPLVWNVCAISFDYDVLGHNGEASLAFSLGPWSATAPLPSTDGDPNNGPIFTPVAVAERATGTVTFNFATDTLTVTRTGYAAHTAAFTDSLSLTTGTYGIDMLVSNTNPLSDGAWDVNAGSSQGQDGFYRVDNFRVLASPVPEPSGALLCGFGFLALLRRRR